MKLSAPIYRLKRKARVLSREAHIPLHEALDRVALEEGFAAWSLLIQKVSGPANKLFARLKPGDLVLLGARPGQGKTLLSLELAAEAMKAGHRSVFFTLEYTEHDVRSLGVDLEPFERLFEFDGSDQISAEYIATKLAGAPRGTLAIVDYLQLLDQRRENPVLATQVETLKAFAQANGVIVVCISQIDRSYDAQARPFPGLQDIRLPNQLDLRLFNRTCFLNNGEVQVQ